jgi:tRNA threonylcarbamoyladenosine biosynthesis protein TsaB
MSLILNIETAIDVCSVALTKDLELVDFLENTDGKSHASQLTVIIDNILKKNNLTVSELSAVSVSMGPGSYTGLRIGVSAAKGICYGASIPLIGVNTLQIMVNAYLKSDLCNITADTYLCPMIDARRLEVYTALFNNTGSMVQDTNALIIESNSFAEIMDNHKIYFFGNGADKCKDLITHPNAVFIDGISPLAKYMGEFSFSLFRKEKFEDVAYFEPFYLKDFVATIPKNKVLAQN